MATTKKEKDLATNEFTAEVNESPSVLNEDAIMDTTDEGLPEMALPSAPEPVIAADEDAETASSEESDFDDSEDSSDAADTPDAVDKAVEDAPLPSVAQRPARRPLRPGEKVVIEDDSDIRLTALTPEQDQDRRWKLVRTALKRGTVIERPIAGVEPADNGRRNPRIIVYYNDVRVVISTKDFFEANLFDEDFVTADQKERNDREFQMASKMLGAYIPFVITHANTAVDESTGEPVFAVTASRRLALQHKRDHYFFGESIRVDTNSRVKARVMMPTNRGVWAEVVGCEVFIPAKALSSCKWINPLLDCPAGTVMYVDVRSINVSQENKTVELEVSRKSMDAALAASAFATCGKGNRYRGTIVSVDANYVRINLDGIHVRAAVPTSGLGGVKMKYGDKVTFHVANKDASRMTVYGSCMLLATRPF